MVVQELNFPAAPWVTFKPNAWKAVQKQLHFPLLPFSVGTVPDTTSALLGTKETGKVTAEHPEDEQTVKESALCADFVRGLVEFRREYCNCLRTTRREDTMVYMRPPATALLPVL